MRVLHTSDWHLGRMLYGRKRHDEFEAFLGWLLTVLQERSVEVLVVAGDVFDTSSPGTRAQQLYYRFLGEVAATGCRYVVVVAGNHDSPAFLSAPRELLRALRVHVVGACSDNADDDLLLLEAADGRPGLLVCAVPYLRDRDIRRAEADESVEQKDQKLQAGIRQHYGRMAELAEQKRKVLGGVPVLATGHLFVAGGQTIDGDGVRELYVGSLAHVGATIFPETFDYVALGHLHVPQRVAGQTHIRYSGSPLPMGFGEARQQKQVCLVDLQWRNGGCERQVELLSVPVFRRLMSVRGDMPTVLQQLADCVAAGSPLWVEVLCDTDGLASDVRRALDEVVAGSLVDIVRVRHTRLLQQVLQQGDVQESLDDLQDLEVFERCLDAHGVSDERRVRMRQLYAMAVDGLTQDPDSDALGVNGNAGVVL